MDNQLIKCRNCNGNIQKSCIDTHILNCNQFTNHHFYAQQQLSKDKVLVKIESKCFSNQDNIEILKNQLECNYPLLEKQQMINNIGEELVDIPSGCFGDGGENEADIQKKEQCQMSQSLQQKICQFCDRILECKLTSYHLADEQQQQHQEECLCQQFECPSCNMILQMSQSKRENHLKMCKTQWKICRTCGQSRHLSKAPDHELICYQTNLYEGIELQFKDQLLLGLEADEEMEEIQTTLWREFQMEKMMQNVKEYKEEEKQRQNEQNAYLQYSEESDTDEYLDQIARQYAEEF